MPAEALSGRGPTVWSDDFCEHGLESARIGVTVEVQHSMDTELRTWQDVVERSDQDLGATPPNTPVERLLNRQVAVSKNQPDLPPPCGQGACGRCID